MIVCRDGWTVGLRVMAGGMRGQCDRRVGRQCDRGVGKGMDRHWWTVRWREEYKNGCRDW